MSTPTKEQVEAALCVLRPAKPHEHAEGLLRLGIIWDREKPEPAFQAAHDILKSALTAQEQENAALREKLARAEEDQETRLLLMKTTGCLGLLISKYKPAGPAYAATYAAAKDYLQRTAATPTNEEGK